MNISAIVRDDGRPVGEATARRVLAQESIGIRNIEGVENHDDPNSNLFYVELEPWIRLWVVACGSATLPVEGDFMIAFQVEDES